MIKLDVTLRKADELTALEEEIARLNDVLVSKEQEVRRMSEFAPLYWYGGNKLKLGQTIFPYLKRYSAVYDSYKLFSDMVSAGGDVCAGGNRVSGGTPGNGGTATGDTIRKQYLVSRMTAVLRGMIAAKSKVA